jgi:hypothetical protein
MPSSQRQEVFNVILAQLLQERGVVVAPESILYTGAQRARQMPDVIVHFQGLRMAIEGEVEAPNARDKAIASAARRVETGVAHIGIGVVYPASLRTVEFEHLKEALAQARLEIAVATEAGSGGFTTGDVNYLERLLRSTFEQLVKEDVVAEAVALLDAAVDQFAAAALAYRGNWGRISLALNGALTDEELDGLKDVERAANCRIGGLILINAMIFHDILAGYYSHITPLATILLRKNLDAFPTDWGYILDEINFYPIFHLAREIYLGLGLAAWGLPEALLYLAKTARTISERRSALRHDLMGRVYHRLLASAKYLGTYYTSIPAATLLLKLALRPEGWPLEWDKLPQVEKLRIADLACGTGTLLMAAADTLADNYISATADAGKKVQLKALHQRITESILHGYDVLASAIHLTASTLAMRTPDVPLKKMNLFSLPLGGTDRMLGSLEFLGGNLVQMPLDLFGALPETESPQQVSGQTMEATRYVTLPELDLCVMNPPYVRSVGGNLLFGSAPEADRTRMQTRLKQLVRRSEVQANITAGLGSVFAAIGDRHIKPGGRLALVLPKALLSGVAWGETRQLINQKYRIDYVVVSHDAERWNFSDSTDLSEVLLVATKNPNNGAPKGQHQTTAVNLWRNPTSALEALAIAAQILEGEPPDLVTGQGAAQLRINGHKAGEVVMVSWDEMQGDWFLPCAFAQADLIRSAYSLLKGELKLPGIEQVAQLPLARLGDLGVLGPDRRDIHDGFELTTSPSAYPAFWGHDAQAMLTLAQNPNQYLSPLPKAKPGRSLRKATDLWPLAGKILLAERMRLNTQRLVAVSLTQKVLSNVWWSFAFGADVNQPGADKALVLWLNSTLGLTILFATRDETEGAWVDFKKPSLAAMPVLDVRKLSAEQLSTLAAAYDRISERELKPLPEMAADEVRAEIDLTVAAALNLPDFSVLRALLAREPVVCMKRL